MSSLIYHVLDTDSQSVIRLSEPQLVDLEKRIRFAYDISQWKGLDRTQLLALGQMKIIDIDCPDFEWDE